MERYIKKLLQTVKVVTNEITHSIVCQFIERFSVVIEIHFQKKTPNIVPHQRDIYECNLGQNIGSELNKKRPCIVISKEQFNTGNTIIILPVKSIKPTTRFGILSIQLQKEPASLRESSYCSCISIREVSKKRLGKYIGEIAVQDRETIKKSL